MEALVVIFLLVIAAIVFFFAYFIFLMIFRFVFWLWPFVVGIGAGLYIWANGEKVFGNILVVAGLIGGIMWCAHLSKGGCRCSIHQVDIFLNNRIN